jgi:hypothetical protein
MPTNFLGKVDYAAEKGGEMETESKGNLLDFIAEEGSKITSLVRKKFLVELYKPDQTPEGLHEFFKHEKFYGVSLEDCIKLLRLKDQIPFEDLDKKY